MMNIKKLKEDKQAKIAEMDAILNTVKQETRAFTAEEDKKYISLEKEVRALDKTIKRLIENSKKIEEKRNGMDNKELMEQELRKLISGEVRAITAGNNGGIIPTTLAEEVVKKLEERADLFSLVRMFTPTAGTLSVPVEKECFLGVDAYEELAKTDENDVNNLFDTVELHSKRYSASIAVSEDMILDSGIDIINYCLEKLIYSLNRQLTNDMISNADTKKIEGIKGKAGNIVTTGIVDSIGVEDLKRMQLNIHPDYLDNSVFIFNRETFNNIAMLQDSIGNFYLNCQRDIVNNKTEYKLFGQPVLINDEVEKMTGTGKEIGYLINPSEAYGAMIKKGIDLKIIDNDTENALKGKVTLMLTSYCDGAVINPKAIVALKQK